jgi:O-antigen ligase/polysaccharide polymerase Wzy-like membrane protein
VTAVLTGIPESIKRAAAAVAVAALALAAGAAVVVAPGWALAALAFVVVLGLAFVAPLVHMSLLVLVTLIVPYSLQNKVGAGATLLPSDVLLLTALFRASVALLREPLDRRRTAVAALTILFLVVAGVQALHGFSFGRSAGQVGYELRVLLGFGAAIVAIALTTDAERLKRLGWALLVIGLLLGVWGLAQWLLGIQEIDESGVGVREGISFTTQGRGQLQGGLYGFPVMAVLAFTALVSNERRTLSARAFIVAVLLTNLLCILLTYERTFWVATVVGLIVVALRAGAIQRRRALFWGPVAALIVLAGLATVAPADLAAARERLVSLSQYSNDDSVRSRIVETRHVTSAIRLAPWTGSGLGALIWWGRPWQSVPPRFNWYAHNGYLWVAWKLGIPGALLLFALIGWAVVSRAPPSEDPSVRWLRIGSQTALLVLLLSSITFPSFNSLSITVTMGVLIAIALAPRLAPAPRDELPAG